MFNGNPDQTESYMPGKPQQMAEPHELAPELLEPEPASESPELEEASETADRNPEPPSFVPRPFGYVPGSPVFYGPPVYRMSPVVYVPGQLVYVPLFPGYRYWT
ncbi:hypothetical protein [Effusibacillus lacus]|uniref:Uncharacterized protein n=1 Tax=Effusibacillus lacus TaxID=1348429 RepID=A0A292YQ57_9BACL|nr:hypothetical protein [Effusibacillus lacus]TCS75720.1 hypothetical protein EDD64_10695 [Effusibacillus lacus]GAX91039.1 hypothetical protein EFBL_2699 [Effusibacillus lacus]